jgi:hypothetical protein
MSEVDEQFDPLEVGREGAFELVIWAQSLTGEVRASEWNLPTDGPPWSSMTPAPTVSSGVSIPSRRPAEWRREAENELTRSTTIR